MIDNLENFLVSEEKEFFITGQAGTGKTTRLKSIVKHLQESPYSFTLMSSTHKAISVMNNIIDDDTVNYMTVHSFLRMVPELNKTAIKVSELSRVSVGTQRDAIPDVIVIDEYSMVNKLSYMKLSVLPCKIIYIGDPNQLLPVNDARGVFSKGPFDFKLTEVYRQKNGDVLDVLTSLADCLTKGVRREIKLKESEHIRFIKYNEILDYYSEEDVLLSFTNSNAQFLNQELQGRNYPLVGDLLYIANQNRYSTLKNVGDNVPFLIGNRNKILLKTDMLYSLTDDYTKYTFYDGDEHHANVHRAGIFGLANYNGHLKACQNDFFEKNKELRRRPNNLKLQNERDACFEIVECLKNIVVGLDFKYSLTIHKSQGSTYRNVFIDMNDMKSVKERNYDLWLRLLYVALSRAQKTLYILGEQ